MLLCLPEADDSHTRAHLSFASTAGRSAVADGMMQVTAAAAIVAVQGGPGEARQLQNVLEVQVRHRIGEACTARGLIYAPSATRSCHFRSAVPP